MAEADQPAASADGRVLALSDGVFAIAATLLALDVRIPAGLDGAGLATALRELGPALAGYAIAFCVIGVLWLGHHDLFRAIDRTTPRVRAANVLLLGLVALLPFPSSLLADYGDRSVVVLIYAANVAGISLVQLLVVAAAARGGVLAVRGAGWAFAPSTLTAAVFLLSMPLALVSPQWAPLSWLLLIPGHVLIDRLEPTAPG